MKIITMKKLFELELQDLAKAIERHEMDPAVGALGFDERLEMILEDVISERERRHMARPAGWRYDGRFDHGQDHI